MKEAPVAGVDLLRLHQRLCLVVAFLVAFATLAAHSWQFNTVLPSTKSRWQQRQSQKPDEYTYSTFSRSRTISSSSSSSPTALFMARRKTKLSQTASVSSSQQQQQAPELVQQQESQKIKKKKKQPPPLLHHEDHSILEDGEGHINSDLATTLYQWEQQHREEQHLPKISFSTRQGLRLVNEMITEMTNSPRGQRLIKGNDKDDSIRTDLVQEGIVALMDALNEYRKLQSTTSTSSSEDADASETNDDQKEKEDPNKQFERYARPILENHLWSTLDRSGRDVQLPEVESTVWRHIQVIRPQLQSELGGREPTIAELAARLEMPKETLELLLATRQASLTLESTVEIKTPDSLEDGPMSTHFADQEKFDVQEGHLLDTGDGILKQEVLVEEYQDEMYQYEGEDEMWLHQAQIAAPLREIIPDGGPTPDDVALSDMIRHDVGEFLTKTLTPEEVKVVRMSFGLDGGKQIVWEEIALSLDDGTATSFDDLMTAGEVKQLLKGALEKLRIAYRNNYVETDWEDNYDYDFGEDTV